MVQKLTGKNKKKEPRHPEAERAEGSEILRSAQDDVRRRAQDDVRRRAQDDVRARRTKTVIGLTGGFGAGKSTVAHLFEELGAFVVDTDKIAHEAHMKGSPVYDKILALFPEAELRDKSGMDRKKIAEIVFRKEPLRKKLEAIVHPYVFERIAEEVGDAEEDVIVVEIPLLFETGFEPFCHLTVAVKAADEATARRLAEKGFSEKDIEARRQAQFTSQEKQERADIIIDNSGTFHQTRREVEKAWKKIHTASKGDLKKQWQKKK